MKQKERYRPLRMTGFRSKWYITVSGRIIRRLYTGEWMELKKRNSNRNTVSLSIKIKLKDGTFPWFSAAELIAYTYFLKFNGEISQEEYRQLKKLVIPYHINGNIRDYNSRNIGLKWRDKDISLYDLLDDTEYRWWFDKLSALDKDKWESFNEKVMNKLLKNLPVLLKNESRKHFFGEKFGVNRTIIARVLKNKV